MLRKRKRQASPLHHDGQTSMGYAATPASNIPDSPKAALSNTDRNLVDFLLDNHDVRQLVLDRLNVHDFAMLAATNKQLREALFEDRFDVNHILLRYFRDPIAFRQLLRQCGAFVGGIFPLSIFEGRYWQEIPLDIYVEPDKYVHLEDFITAGERYDVVSEFEQQDTMSDSDSPCPLISTFKSIFPDGRTEAIRLIQPFELTRPIQPVDDPLLWVFAHTMHLTPESCLMTWNRLISLYPRITFLEHKMYAFFDELTDELGTKLSSFASNDWPLEDLISYAMMRRIWHPGDDHDLPDAEPFIPTSLNSVRRVGDSHAYHIRLNTDGIDIRPTVLDYSVDYCEFWVHPIHPRGFNFPPLRSTWRFILDRLNELLPYEVLRLPDDQRPEGSLSEPDDNGVRYTIDPWAWPDETDRNNLQKPPNWQYRDHMIPVWYDFYLEREAKHEAEVKAHLARREQEARRSTVIHLPPLAEMLRRDQGADFSN